MSVEMENRLIRVVASANPKNEAEIHTTLLGEILMALWAIQEATEQANEPGPDDEPSPFQSLSG